MFRKVALVFIIVFLAEYAPQIRVVFAALLVFAALILHVKYQPYDDDDLDLLELWSLLASFLTLFLGIFFVIPGVPTSWRTPMAWLIIFVNSAVMIMFSISIGSVASTFAKATVEKSRKSRTMKKAAKAAAVAAAGTVVASELNAHESEVVLDVAVNAGANAISKFAKMVSD